MILKNIKDDRGFIFTDEQVIQNRRYRVSTVYVPSIGIDTEKTRISVSKIDESKQGIEYEEIHAIDLEGEKIKGIIYFDDRNRSSGGFREADNQEDFFSEVINSFDELIASGESDLSDEAIEIVSRVKDKIKTKKMH